MLLLLLGMMGGGDAADEVGETIIGGDWLRLLLGGKGEVKMGEFLLLLLRGGVMMGGLLLRRGAMMSLTMSKIRSSYCVVHQESAIEFFRACDISKIVEKTVEQRQRSARLFISSR